MKIHLVINDEQYESTDFVAAYADHGMAQRRVEKMNASLESYTKRNRKLEEEGQGREFEEAAPHSYHALAIRTMVVIPAKSNRKEKAE